MNESELGKEAVVKFEALFRHFPGRSEQNYERDSIRISSLKVEVSTGHILITSATHSIPTFGRILLEKTIVTQLVKKLPTSHGTKVNYRDHKRPPLFNWSGFYTFVSILPLSVFSHFGHSQQNAPWN
jgi:hypothetical protein